MTTTTRAVVGLTINVGNAAVQTIEDVAAILAEAARDLLSDRASISALDDRSMPLADLNGNIVGHVQVTGYSVEQDDQDACPACGSVNRWIRFGRSECSDCGASVALDSEG